MTFSKYSKVFWIFTLSLIMSHMPEVAAATATLPPAEQMISTNSAVEMLSRSETESKVREHLQNEQLRTALQEHGVSADEVSSRLASLSNAELNQLATQMDQAKYGGDVGGILIVVLLVVLIIYLIKRI